MHKHTQTHTHIEHQNPGMRKAERLDQCWALVISLNWGERAMGTKKHYDLFPICVDRTLIRHIHIIPYWPESSNYMKKHLLIGNSMQMTGAERKTNPTDNWLSLPCFCAWMSIFTLLSRACWLFYQTKRLAVFHILVLWNGLSGFLSLRLSYFPLFPHPLCLSLCACRILTESNTTCQESAVWTDMR